MSFEGDIDEDDELNTHHVRNGTEAGNEAECYWTWSSVSRLDWSTCMVGVEFRNGMGFITHFLLSQPIRAKVQSYWEKG